MIPNMTIDDLTLRIRERKVKHSPEGPYILFLGEGCAAAAGAPSRLEIARKSLRMFNSDKQANLDSMPADQVFSQFEAYCASLSPKQVARMVLSLYPKLAVPSFYQYLAMLIQEQYFQLILTMNFDTLLEQALANAGFRTTDYRVTTFFGSGRTSSIDRSESTPLTHIVKLHGDLAQDVAQVSPDQIEEALMSSRRWIKADMKGDMIMVAHTESDDLIDDWLGHYPDRDLWWVSESPQFDKAKVQSWSVRPVHEVVGEIGSPKVFFQQLALRLMQPAASSQMVEEEAHYESAPLPSSMSMSRAIVLPDPTAETLRNEIFRSQSVLYNLEQQGASGERPPNLQAQIAYEKRRSYNLEDRIRSLPTVKPIVLEVVEKIQDKIRNQGPAVLDPDSVKAMIDFIETLTLEMKKEKPNQLLISAGLGAVLTLCDRLATEYGERVVEGEDVKTLAALIPTAASKVVL